MDALQTAVLEEVNEIRINILKLPPVTELQKGIKGEGDCCPIANTLCIGSDQMVNVDHYEVYLGKDESLPTSRNFCKFMDEFDGGHAYDDLDADRDAEWKFA